MTKRVSIYVLFDTRTPDEARYVGCTTRPRKRLQEHIRIRKGDAERHKTRWIQKVLRDGGQVDMRLVDECGEDEWQELEQAWVAKLRSQGHRLTNETNGGNGIVGLSPDARARWIATRSTPEFRKSLSDARKGKKQSPGVVEKRRIAILDAFKRPDVQERRAASYIDPERRAKLSAARKSQRGLKRPNGIAPERRKNLARPGNQSRRGTSTSPEGIENMKRAQSARGELPEVKAMNKKKADVWWATATPEMIAERSAKRKRTIQIKRAVAAVNATVESLLDQARTLVASGKNQE